MVILHKLIIRTLLFFLSYLIHIDKKWVKKFNGLVYSFLIILLLGQDSFILGLLKTGRNNQILMTLPNAQKVTKTNFVMSYPVARKLINISCLLTLLVFIISLFSPLFTLEKFYFFSNTVSLVSALLSLLEKGHLLLFLLIFVFSILFPLFKLGVLFYIWNSHAGATVQQLLKWIHQFGKWSMLDVFVVALMVVSIKFDQVVNMQIHYGLYLFSSAVLLSMLISAISSRFLEKHMEM